MKDGATGKGESFIIHVGDSGLFCMVRTSPQHHSPSEGEEGDQASPSPMHPWHACSFLSQCPWATLGPLRHARGPVREANPRPQRDVWPVFLVDMDIGDACAPATFCAVWRQDEPCAFTRFLRIRLLTFLVVLSCIYWLACQQKSDMNLPFSRSVTRHLPRLYLRGAVPTYGFDIEIG